MPPTPFFCTLCGKGYARAPELQAHENSYDHQHKKRLREMKAMTRKPGFMGGDSKPARRRGEDLVLGANVQAPTRVAAEVVREESPEETTTVIGPLPWESLGEVHDLVNLEWDRPSQMQRFVDGRKDYLAVRRDKGFYKDIWDAMGTVETEGEKTDEEERAGLGAGGYSEESGDDVHPGLGASTGPHDGEGSAA